MSRPDPATDVFEAHRPRLARLAYRMLGSLAEAEDVVQEAYVHGYEKLGSFRGEASLATWLTRIALNEAYGRLRRRRDSVDIDDINRGAPVAAQLIAFPGHVLGEDPAEEAARAQLRRLLEQAVDELPEAFRLVYVLRDVEGCSVEETASALEIRQETVKTRLHRARRQLREVLASRVSAARVDAFQFMGARCARMTDVVMARIAALPRTQA